MLKISLTDEGLAILPAAKSYRSVCDLPFITLRSTNEIS